MKNFTMAQASKGARRMRLGILGGSFDPVHNGHLQLARYAQKQARLDQIRFVPTAVQPHKLAGPIASEESRCAMLRLALVEFPRWQVGHTELERGGVSYTVDTLRTIEKNQPEVELFFLMGADSLHDFPKWREPAEICRLATLLVVCRPGDPTPDFSLLAEFVTKDRFKEIEDLQIVMPPVAVSSTEIRLRIENGEAINHLVPPAVAAYVAAYEIYHGCSPLSA